MYMYMHDCACTCIVIMGGDIGGQLVRLSSVAGGTQAHSIIVTKKYM